MLRKCCAPTTCDGTTAGQSIGDGELAGRRGSVQVSVAGVSFDDHPSVRSTWGLPPLPAAGRAAQVPRVTLLRVEVAEPCESLRTLVRSYRTVSPLTVPGAPEVVTGHRRSAFCCPDREITPSWLSPAPCSSEPRPSSMWSSHTAVIRPTHRRHQSARSPGAPKPGRAPGRLLERATGRLRG